MSVETEPDDNHIYHHLSFNNDTLHFYLKSLIFYEELLREDIASIESDKDLAFLLTEQERKDLEIQQELNIVVRFKEALEKIVQEQGEKSWGYMMALSHGDMRFLKSVALLYLRQLQNRRNILSLKPRVSRHALQAVDQRFSYFEEKTRTGVFNIATPKPLLVSDLVAEADSIEPRDALDSQTKYPLPILIDSIEILDPELKFRCLDLFQSFKQDGQHERLDTVVTEATRILEDKLRSASAAPDDVTGVELAAFAFSGKSPKLIVSEVPAEQDAVHLLFRGVFGFIRNHVHHQLVENLSPERVLQIVGMVDYLIFLAQNATKASADNGSTV